MRAGQLVAPGRLACVEVDPPRPGGGDDVLVRTLLASVCGSDVHHVHGDAGPLDYPCRPGYRGHEGVGEVVGGGGLAPGTPVLTVPDRTRAACFAELQVLPSRFLIALPPGDPARLLLAQQLGTVLFALGRFWPEPRPGGCAAVIGTGSAGLLFVQLLKRRGWETVIAADLEPARRALAARMGADVLVDAGAESVAEAVRGASGGQGAALVVEAAGRDAARAQAVAAVADLGRIGFFGLPERPGDVPFPFATLFERRATTVVSNLAQLEPGLASFRAAVAAIADGEIDVEPLVTHRLPLDRVGEAVALAATRADGAVKVVVEMGRAVSWTRCPPSSTVA